MNKKLNERFSSMRPKEIYDSLINRMTFALINEMKEMWTVRNVD